MFGMCVGEIMDNFRFLHLPGVRNGDYIVISMFLRSPDGSPTLLFMIISTVFVLGAANYVRCRAVLLNSLLHILEDVGN